MNYEQRYKEALEAVKELQEANLSDDGIQNWVNDNFPELRESEDEKIRKELLQIAKESEDSFYMVMTPNKREHLIAWLEKQGETFTKKDVDDAYIEGMAFAKYELEKQKPAWSEEDESMYTRTLGILGKCYMGNLPTKVEEELKWFKSLKQRIGG